MPTALDSADAKERAISASKKEPLQLRLRGSSEKRRPAFRIYCTKAEKAEIKRRADQLGISPPAYLRQGGVRGWIHAVRIVRALGQILTFLNRILHEQKSTVAHLDQANIRTLNALEEIAKVVEALQKHGDHPAVTRIAAALHQAQTSAQEIHTSTMLLRAHHTEIESEQAKTLHLRDSL